MFEHAILTTRSGKLAIAASVLAAGVSLTQLPALAASDDQKALVEKSAALVPGGPWAAGDQKAWPTPLAPAPG
ncbi:MAG: hypothetical protein OER56_12920 [Hyphomicrobiales bacterium]|nr:hypothetical protein [Hyphomicrobiales bacterium]